METIKGQNPFWERENTMNNDGFTEMVFAKEGAE